MYVGVKAMKMVKVAQMLMHRGQNRENGCWVTASIHLLP